MGKIKDRVGHRYGSLVVTHRAPSSTKGTARWYCQCDCSATAIVRSDHLALGYVKSCGDRTVHTPLGRNQARGYNATHEKIRNVLGSASDYRCNADGCPQDAREWAYDHRDPDEVITVGGHAYSLKADHYVPFCNHHHQIYDGAFHALRDAVASQ